MADDSSDFGSDDDFDMPISDQAPVQRIRRPMTDENTKIERTDVFEASPSIVHFSGIVPGQEHVITVSVINISSVIQRMQIVPPASLEYFKVDFEKSGSLAPGLSQKLTIRFYPKEYKYYSDIIRIRSKEKTLLIPLHGYPVLNKVDFPASMSFGNTPICEPRTKIINLKCSIPVDFSFKLTVAKPHPYFKVEPLQGTIPANSSIPVKVTFCPYTLGTCIIDILLEVGQYGFVPLNCNISAKAVSGLVESEELKQAEKRVIDYIIDTGNRINNTLGQSTFRGDLTLKSAMESTNNNHLQQTNFLSPTKTKGSSSAQDPVSAMLSNTFQSNGLNMALDRAVNTNTKILGHRTVVSTSAKENTGNAGPRGSMTVSLPKSSIPVHPRGPGSGAVFDAGTEWITMQMKKTSFENKSSKFTTRKEDRIVEGLRIPSNLNTTYNVNFVITQEAGKLKPKDLKAAIDKNRAQKEARAEEQRLMREAGGGLSGLDLRGIIAEERLNLEEGDPFKRQLREMAFLADVDDVNKQEIEKQFRVSEEYLGSNLLSEEDIEIIQKQRRQAAYHKRRSQWRSIQSRQHTAQYPPHHAQIKAGTTQAIARRVSTQVVPHFDPNRNDIWGMRMNTVRKLLSLVGKWMIRNRLDTRMGKIRAFFASKGIYTREEARAFIEKENATHKTQGSTSSTNKNNNSHNNNTNNVNNDSHIDKPVSVAALVCSRPDPRVTRRQTYEALLRLTSAAGSDNGDEDGSGGSGGLRLTSNMACRVLYPQFHVDEAAERSEVACQSMETATLFQDKTFFQLKNKPDFEVMGYNDMSTLPMPSYFPPNADKYIRVGAYEERAQRPSADTDMDLQDLLAATATLNTNIPKVLTPYIDLSTLSNPVLRDPNDETAIGTQKEASHGKSDGNDDEDKSQAKTVTCIEDNFHNLPAWLSEDVAWTRDDLSLFQVKNEYRSYMAEPMFTECDADWDLRPHGGSLSLDADLSLRHSLLTMPGFLSVQNYALGNYETRSADSAPPLPAPTISEGFLQDSDRHRSGLACFARDHRRALQDLDQDVPPLREKQDREDVLTDSESDDEDGYAVNKPTIAHVRSILSNPVTVEAPVANTAAASNDKKGAAPAKGKAPPAAAPAAAPAPLVSQSLESDAMSALGEEKRREEQVELLRDRKILDLNDQLRKERQSRSELVADRLKALSTASSCALLKLRVQVPLHTYEDKLYAEVAPILSNLPTSCVESSLLDLRQSHDTLRASMDSLASFK